MRHQLQSLYRPLDHRSFAAAKYRAPAPTAALCQSGDREYQFWQEGVHAELILNEVMMREKLDYIRTNPVKRGYVNLP